MMFQRHLGRFARISSSNHIQQCHRVAPFRSFSTKPPEDDPTTVFHPGIQTHPDSISHELLPEGLVYRTARDGSERKRYVDFVHGYFWMVKDLQRSEDQPILTNTELIPEDEARMLPPLLVETMENTVVTIPDMLTETNRLQDPSAQATLLAVCSREHGRQVLQEHWLPKLRQLQSERLALVLLQLNEGFVARLLRPLINFHQRRAEDTVVQWYGTATPYHFRDPIRLHNSMTGYVYLLDGIGRVRAAGSGPSSQVDRFCELAQQLVRPVRIRRYGKKR